LKGGNLPDVKKSLIREIEKMKRRLADFGDELEDLSEKVERSKEGDDDEPVRKKPKKAAKEEEPEGDED